MTAIDPYGQSSADDGLVARVRGAAAAELARRLGPARLFTPSEDDQALVWSVIAEQLADAHREHVLAGGVPLDDPARRRLGQTVFDALLGLGPLERYLAHPDVEELLVNGHQQAFVLRSRRHQGTRQHRVRVRGGAAGVRGPHRRGGRTPVG